MLRKLKLLNQLTSKIMAEGNNISLVRIATEETMKIFQADFGFAWGELHLGDGYKIIHKTKNIIYEPIFPFERKKQIPGQMSPLFDLRVKQENYKTKLLPHLKSYIILPLRYFDNSYGNIVLCYKKQRNFTAEELVLSKTVGNAIAQSLTINWLIESERKALILSQKQEEHFRALVENSYELIIQIDKKGKILYVSPSVEKMMGMRAEDFIGKDIQDFSQNKRSKKTLDYIKDVLKNPHKRHVEEFTRKDKNGNVLYFESISTKMPEEEGKGGVIINIRDVTERKKLEEAKIAERQLIEEKIKVDSIADATHELRTPLAIIKGNVDLARQGQSKNLKSLKSIIKDIDHEVTHLSDIISDLALITSKPRGVENLISAERVNLKELVEESVERCMSLAYKKDISITTNETPNIDISGDKDYLEKLLINLIKNSINYGKEGGRTKVRTVISKGYVTIDVEDNGIGISKEDLPHIFERFYRGDKSHSSLHSEGTGLGLSIVKWIAETHKGSVSVKSTLNKGTTFSVKLPAKRRS